MSGWLTLVATVSNPQIAATASKAHAATGERSVSVVTARW